MNHTSVLYSLAVAGALGLAVIGVRVSDLKQRVVYAETSARHVGPGKLSRLSWPELTPEQTIALGEALEKLGPGQVTIYCSSPPCEALRTDLDDAFQIANWKSDFEDRFVDSEADTGLFIGPPSNEANALADVIEATTGVKPKSTGIDGITGVGIILGKRP